MTMQRARGWEFNPQAPDKLIFKRASKKIRRRLALPELVEAFFPAVGPNAGDYVDLNVVLDSSPKFYTCRLKRNVSGRLSINKFADLLELPELQGHQKVCLNLKSEAVIRLHAPDASNEQSKDANDIISDIKSVSTRSDDWTEPTDSSKPNTFINIPKKRLGRYVAIPQRLEPILPSYDLKGRERTKITLVTANHEKTQEWPAFIKKERKSLRLYDFAGGFNELGAKSGDTVLFESLSENSFRITLSDID